MLWNKSKVDEKDGTCEVKDEISMDEHNTVELKKTWNRPKTNYITTRLEKSYT